MEILLKKYMWLLDAVTVAICAAILGSLTAGMVAHGLGRPPPLKLVAPEPKAAEPAEVRDKSPDAILRRNIFCSTCPPIRLDGDPEPVVLPDLAPLQPQPTQLPLKLLAVMYAPSLKAQRWNMAVIRDNELKTVGAFRAGAHIHGAVVLSVRDTRVYLDHAGATEFVDLMPSPAVAPAVPARPAPIVVQPGDALSQELDRGIKKLGEHRYEIQRGTLNSVLGNLALLSRSARIVPEVRGGTPVGFRLFAVKPDGPFAKIGLQNGDVIASINGLDMSSPEKALEVYSKLKSASHLDLGLERNGQRISSDYLIR